MAVEFSEWVNILCTSVCGIYVIEQINLSGLSLTNICIRKMFILYF